MSTLLSRDSGMRPLIAMSNFEELDDTELNDLNLVLL